MDENGTFKKEKLNIINKIVGNKLEDIFFQQVKPLLQDNLFVINFRKSKAYSIHVACFLRIFFGSELLLTSSDEYLNTKHEQMEEKEYIKAYTANYVEEDCLLKKSIKKVKQVFKETKVNNVQINDLADITIVFDNGGVIEIRTDCQMNNYEFYRFFEIDSNSKHYIVEYKNNSLSVSVENPITEYETMDGKIVKI